MVQGCTQMHGVHQGSSGSIILIELIQPFTCEHKGCYLAIIETNAG